MQMARSPARWPRVCADEKQAKVFAHAMKLSDTKRFEVWLGERLVYARPEYWDVESRKFAAALRATT